MERAAPAPPVFDGASAPLFAQSEQLGTLGPAADETASGYTLAVDPAFGAGGVAVVHDNGAAHVAFPSAYRIAPSVVRCLYRKGTAHTGGTPAELVYRDVTISSAGVSAVGAETVAVAIGEPYIDNRDGHIYADANGVLRVSWHVYVAPTTEMQCFARALAGGRIDNVTGYPLTNKTPMSCGRPQPFDRGERFAVYGGPLFHTSPYRIGIIRRDTGTLLWLREPTHHLFEPCVVRVDASTLVCLARTAVAYDATLTRDTMQYARSTDDGATWSEWRQFSFIGDAPHALIHSSGLLIFGVREHAAPSIYTSLIWSADGGQTWGAPTRIFNHGSNNDSSYPALVEMPDGSILVFFYSDHARYIKVTKVLVT